MRRSALALLLALPLLVAADPGADAPEAQRPQTPEEAGREALELELRQAAMRALAADLQARLEDLEKLRGELEAALVPAQAEAKEELDKLVAFYQAMKPKNAAKLLEKLDAGLAADVLSAMKTRQAGKILDAMGAQRAVVISRRMAGK